MSDKATQFSFQLINEFLGYNSSRDKTNVDSRMLVRGSLNVYKKLSGTIASRPGQKRRGTADATSAAITSEYVWNTSWGAVLPLRVANAKLEVEYNGVWYQLLGSLTKTRYVFDKWFNKTLAKDFCLFVNGTADMFSWGGGNALIDSTTADTIVLDRTIVASVLPSASGSVVINGNTYAYTGSSGSTLTGVTPDPTGEADDSVVLEAVVTQSNKPAAGFLTDFIKVINNQVYAGSYASRLCYISQDIDYTNYTVPTPRVPGSPELLTLDGALKGIGVRQGKAHIGIGTGSWAVVSFADITVGTTLTQKTTVDVKPMANLAGPYAHEFIDTVGDTLIYLSQDQQIRTFGDYRNLFTPAYPSVSQEISTELAEQNFTGGALRCIGDFTYLTCPNNGLVFLYQVRQSVNEAGDVVSERLWHPPQVWNITRVDEISGVVYGFSNANPQLYQLWDTGQWFDDSPSGEELPYSCALVMAYNSHGRRAGLLSFDKVFVEGYLSQGTPLKVQVKYNYQGALAIADSTINTVEQPAYLFTGAAGNTSLGDSSLGENPLGEGMTEAYNDQELLPKFKIIKSLGLQNCFEYQIIVYSDTIEENSRWEVLALGTNVDLEREEQANFLINKVRR
jgi:hypothetical protein